MLELRFLPFFVDLFVKFEPEIELVVIGFGENSTSWDMNVMMEASDVRGVGDCILYFNRTCAVMEAIGFL